MSKTSKRAILTIIVIATFLTVMIPFVPVMADMGPVSVSGATTVDVPTGFYTLLASGGTAAWDITEARNGEDSVKLTSPGVGYGLLTLPIEMDFEDLDDFSCYVAGASDQDLPLLDIELLMPLSEAIAFVNGKGTSITVPATATRVIISTQPEDAGPLVTDSDTETWEQYGTHSGAGIDVSGAAWRVFWAPLTGPWGSSEMGESPDDLMTWDQIIAAFSGTTVKHFRVELTYPPDSSEIYVDDIKINDVTYPLERKGSKYDVELTVSGGGVTSGTPVNIYWDYVTAANVMDTITAGADGTYECDVDVPSDVFGNHYIWAKDTSTGISLRWDGTVFVLPRLKFSPSSGLDGDDITIKGYGFSAESDVNFVFGTLAPTDTGKATTDELGYFEYEFEVEATTQTDYPVKVTDEYGISVTADFTVGASITVDLVSGSSGSIIEVSGEGFDGDIIADIPSLTSVELIGDGDPLECYVIDDFEVDDGEFTVEIVIPSVDDIDDYEEIEVTVEYTGATLTKTVEADFEVTGTTSITIDPAFGVQGSTVSIEGYNFTAIDEEKVDLVLLPEGGTSPTNDIAVDDFETDSDGEFSGTFIVPAVQSGLYTLIARQEAEAYGIETTEDFNVGIMIVILNPSYGASGTKIYLTGTGFTTDEDWNATFGDIDILPTDETDTVDFGTVSDSFFVPSVDVGTYTVTVMDIDRDITVTVDFNVVATTVLELDPAAAPNDYNLTIEGSYFTAEAGIELDFVLYNATEDWDPIDMDVLQGKTTPVAAVTDEDGNFTAYWFVLDDETLSIGDYTINVTDDNDLFAQIAFSVAEERVDVKPRKESFDIGDTVSFDVQNDFIYPDSYLKIWDPADNLYWVTEPIASAAWVKVESLYTVPYYKQTSGENPMLLSPDAPLDTWTWAFYKDADNQLINGTFTVGRSSTDILGEQIEALSEGLTEIVTSTTALAESVEAVSGAATEAAAAAATAAAAAADAKTAANAAATAVADVGDIATDALDAANDAANAADAARDAADSGLQAALDALVKAQESVDAANEARESADANRQQTSGLTGLVYGAIGASLIAALAAIVSLMQISRRIAG